MLLSGKMCKNERSTEINYLLRNALVHHAADATSFDMVGIVG